MDILRIEHLKKSFGDQTVLKDINLSVKEGSIFGLLGPNGAGKTTTIKAVLGLLKPSEGNITVMGEQVKYGETKTNRFIGYLPDVPEFYNYMTPEEYLKLCGELSNMPMDKIKKRSKEMIEIVGLTKANKRIGGFSRGMKQRLGLAQALLNEPKLLICDEPTSALDPVGRKEILDIILNAKGKTSVIFSTHILSDVERICDEIAIVDYGKIVLNGLINEVKEKRQSQKILIDFSDINHKNKFKDLPECKQLQYDVDDATTNLVIKVGQLDEAISKVMQILVSNQIIPRKMEVIEPSLEDLFLEVLE